jgi:D-amino peptidase
MGGQMKIYLSVDMEGVAGIVHDNQCEATHAEYPDARRLMIAETNAAIAGAFEAGATEVYVNDAHYTMRNLEPESLDKRAMLVSGTFKPQSMMAGLDHSFAAVAFIGYHAKAHSPKGILAHTCINQVSDVRINGVSVGEYGLNALVAGAYDVPVVCVTGDNVVCEQTRSLLGEEVVGVVVKHGLSNIAAISVHPEVAREKIKQSICEGIEKREKIKPYQPETPITLQVDWGTVLHADLCEQIPGVERVAARTVRYQHDKPLVVFRSFFAMLDISETFQVYTPLPRFG